MSISAYLTLGSNLGARATNIQTCLKAVRQQCGKVISTSFMYETAPQLILDQPNFINVACHIRTDLAPAELLEVVKCIESDLGRDHHGLRYGPRVIDIDLALYGDAIVDIENGDRGLQIPHLRLGERDFVLQPLCDINPDLHVPDNKSTFGKLDTTVSNLFKSLRAHSINDGVGAGLLQRVMPVNSCAGEERLWAWGPGSTKTLVMGILNATPDSFSDGGRVHSKDGDVDIQRAVAAAHKLMTDGADVIDVGGESTRPNADFVSPEQEVSRVVPLIEAIKTNLPHAVVSVDTRRAYVAELALQAGASIVNDVSGGTHDVTMRDLVSREACPYIVMHMKGNPKTMASMASYSDSDSSITTGKSNRRDSGVVEHVRRSLSTLTQDAQDAGVSRWNLMVDPGLGFAKETKHNLELLRSLSQLSDFPLLVGASRKRFLGEILPHRAKDATTRDWGTVATTAAAVAGQAAAVRVHNVEANVDVARVSDAVWKSY